MARSLGSLTVDLLMKTGSFETDAGRAARVAEKRAKEIDAAFNRSMSSVTKSLAGMAAGFLSAQAVYQGFANAINQADRLDELSAKLGISTEKLSAWGYAAKMTGTDIESVNKSLDKLSKSAAAAMDGSSRMGQLFNTLGISVKDANGNLRSAEKLLPEVADAFKAMNNNTLETAIAMEVFGKSGAEMLEFLNKGSDGLSAMEEKARSLGIVISGEAASAAAEFKDEVDNLRAALQGAMTQIAAEMLPAVRELTEAVTDFVSSGNGAAQTADALGNAMQVAGGIIDFAFITPLRVLGDVIEGATTATIGLMTSLKGLVGMDLGKIKAGFEVWKEGAGLAVFGSERMAGPKPAAGMFDNVQGGYSGTLQGRDLQLAQARMKKQAESEERLLAWLSGEGEKKGAAKRTAKGGKSEAQRQMEEAAKAAEALTEAQDNARRTLEDWRAELDGPAAQALLKYSRMERDLDEQVAAGEISWKQYADAMGMVSEMRAKDEALMTDQQKAAKALAEAQADAAAEYERTWRGAVESVSYAFADFITGGLNSFKDFGRSLKDIARRFIADLIGQFANNALQSTIGNWFRQLTSGGFAQAGQSGTGGFLSQLFGGGAQGGGFLNTVVSAVGRFFGMGGAQAGSVGGFGSNLGALASLPGGVVLGDIGTGGLGGYTGDGMGGLGSLVQLGGMAGKGGSFLTSAAAPWLGAAGGALYGWNQGGDTAGKLGGAAAYGTLGYTALMTGGGLAGATAGYAAGGLWGGISGGIGALGPAGWIALGAIAIDKISGGKLFGTKFKADSAAQQLDIGADGGTGFTSVTEVRQRSLFRGRKWRTTKTGLDAEAQSAVDELFDAIMGSMADAASMMGIDVPDMIAGSFRREFDKNGNLKKEFSTIAGRVYNEGQEAFAMRLQAENLLAVAKAVGSSAELEQLAEGYRASAEALSEFATVALAMQADFKAGTQLWAGSLTDVVGMMERMGKAGESLAETYARVTGVAREYGQLIGGVESALVTRDLNDYQRAQLDVEMGYRAQVKQANELAKSLGLSGARAEDLAKIEQLRAVNMAALQKQYEAQKNTFLQDLGLSDLSPLRDNQKLASSMEMLREAVGAGDLQRAQQLSQQVLGFGRNLYASGADYNGLYAEVTGLLGGMTGGALDGFTETGLDNIADLLEGLPDKFARAIFQQAALVTPLPTTPPTTPPPLQPPGGTTGGTGGGDDNGAILREILRVLQMQQSQQLTDSLNRSMNGTAVL